MVVPSIVVVVSSERSLSMGISQGHRQLKWINLKFREKRKEKRVCTFEIDPEVVRGMGKLVEIIDQGVRIAASTTTLRLSPTTTPTTPMAVPTMPPVSKRLQLLEILT
ncbi:hypothetical protein V8G54_003754 [Vigna mungo]|uniref:Uncharacterized protein n=1 Tax=Vigna mungo TaxID=3915 RepID=A0AAQ3PCU2_VIGMU